MPVQIICQTCRKVCYFPPSQSNRKYCSDACYPRKGDRNPNWKGGLADRVCQECGSDFQVKHKEVKAGRGKFCCRSCAAKKQSRERSEEFKKKRVRKQCVICGTIKLVKESHKHVEGKYCSIKCRTEGYKRSNIFSGSSNPNYRHGNSGVSGFYQNQRRCAEGHYEKKDIEKLESNQKGKCVNCHVKLNRTGYHVDHIFPIFLGGSNWPSNLQLLCPSCNCKKNAKHPLEWAKENGRLL